MSDIRVSFPDPCGERWEDMRHVGCNRHCDTCDKVIHDLSQMTIDDVGALVRTDPEPCVRAHINRDGFVAIKGSVNSRRLAIAVGSSLSLVTAACQTGTFPPRATIAGKVESPSFRLRVKVRGTDGTARTAEVNGDGTFEIKNLYYGVYSLTFWDTCGQWENVETVVVRDSTVELGKVDWEDNCIIVGMMSVDPDERG